MILRPSGHCIKQYGINIDMRKAKSKYFCDKIETCSQMKDSKNGWAWINTLLGRKRKNPNINELIINDKVISDDKIMAETFNEYILHKYWYENGC